MVSLPDVAYYVAYYLHPSWKMDPQNSFVSAGIMESSVSPSLAFVGSADFLPPVNLKECSFG